jgi:flagellar FliJ protein
MKWAQSLIRISTHQVEELQKRLGEIVGRRNAVEVRLTMLHAEAEAEKQGAASNAEAGWYHIGFLEGWRYRRSQLEADLAQIMAEEAGARDALTSAFEELKKYEQVAESARVAGVKEADRKHNIEMDEVSSRMAARAR